MKMTDLIKKDSTRHNGTVERTERKRQTDKDRERERNRETEQHKGKHRLFKAFTSDDL